MEEAVRTKNPERVQELIQGGADVNTNCKGIPLLSLAIQVGLTDIAQKLIDRGADVKARDAAWGRTALHWACEVRDGREIVVPRLIDKGSLVNEEDNQGQTPLSLAAKWGGMHGLANRLLRAGASCQSLPPNQKDLMVRYACRENDGFVVNTLIANGCNINTTYTRKASTLLMAVVEDNFVDLVKILILANANVNLQDKNGFTALHYAALHNHIQCGVLLAEGGANVGIKDEHSRTALDVASSEEFKEAIKVARSFTISKTLFIVGNTGVGKSTLIASLKAERNSFFGKAVNQFKKVTDCRNRTAGIEHIPYCSQRYGDVLFFDFAGQQDYCGPHQMFLEPFLSNPGVSMTFLLVVKLKDDEEGDEEAILKQLHDWLFPVAQMATAASPPQVIVIGSFLDQVRSKHASAAMLARCIEETKKCLFGMPLNFMGSCILNCRKPQSEGIDQLCSFLRDVAIPELKAIQTQYSLAWVWSQVRVSFSAKAVQLCELSKWMQENSENLPPTIPLLEKVCKDLSSAGLALCLPNKDNSHDGWLVLDLSSILHDVYGTLFSLPKESMNRCGLLHCKELARYFPHLSPEMIQQLLIGLKFCTPVDPSILSGNINKEDGTLLFFPALLSAEQPKVASKDHPQQSVCSIWWQLWTSEKHSFTAGVVQYTLLRLITHFVVSHKNAEGVQEHCCSIWKNGIIWQSKTGVDVTVHMLDNRALQVFGSSEKTADSLCQYLNDVIADIISTIRQLSPNLQAAAYIVHPPLRHSLFGDTRHPSKKPKLFPVVDIEHSIINGEEYSLSRDWKESLSSGSKELVADLFGGYTPSLQDIKRINWTQHDLQTPSLDSALSDTHAGQVHGIPSQCASAHSPVDFIPAASNPLLTAIDESRQLQLQPTPSASSDHPRPVPVADSHLPLSMPTATPQLLLAPTLAAPQCLAIAAAESLSPVPIPTLTVESSQPTATATNEGLEGTHTLIDASSKPTAKDLIKLVVTPVASGWERLALRLGVEYCVINGIKKNHPIDCQRACRNMLNSWLQGQSYTGEDKRTWFTLLNALDEADHVDLARELWREHFQMNLK